MLEAKGQLQTTYHDEYVRERHYQANPTPDDQDDWIRHDPETGELVIDVPNAETGEIETKRLLDVPTAQKLVGLAAGLKRLEAQAEQVEATRKIQVERIDAIAKHAGGKITEQYGQLMLLAEEALEAAKTEGIAVVDKKLRPSFDVVGRGRFAFRTKPVGVDDSAWKEMGDDEQAGIISAEADLFRKKVTFAPDKKAIKAVLQKDESVLGFTLKGGDDQLTFKVEE